MIKTLLSTLLLACILSSCSTSKQIEKSLSAGNYDQAIHDAIGKLRTNKDKKGKADFIAMLQEAYNKANERDLTDINFLKKDNNPENYLRIYDMYVGLNNRQELIKPILPLSINGKTVKFNLTDYSSDIIKFKNDASLQIYNNATALLKSKNKLDARQAFAMFQDIEDINPNYKDVRNLLEVAHTKGIDFVLVDMINDTRKTIPKRLEDDLLNFSTYGLNNLWTVYHNTRVKEVHYDYNMRVNLRDINLSPEQIKERQIIKEKQVADGKKNLLDSRGKKVKDSLGNAVQVDRMVTVRCEYYESTQFKSAQVTGNVEYINLKNKQLVDAFPISSEFVFQHVFASSQGDRRALETTLLPFLNNRRVPFPTEEQMIYDTGEDLKLQLKQIINSYNPTR
ncbi:hypothetical protein QLS71_018210 [Mariniflexile litorale]|uniref:Lipoprotein n=1 Tax=Mariniflexile litorale TaxID=3045158 RepID=A0AAU7EF77_9FLAO|nr:hypothetical protein [Mariniflexile sp. KMM 9835]MDQ8211862.1 hypothetical protein [Mariniflexile sp. KMM 9835]